MHQARRNFPILVVCCRFCLICFILGLQLWCCNIPLWLCPAWLGSGSARLGPARLGFARLGTPRFVSAPARLGPGPSNDLFPKVRDLAFSRYIEFHRKNTAFSEKYAGKEIAWIGSARPAPAWVRSARLGFGSPRLGPAQPGSALI